MSLVDTDILIDFGRAHTAAEEKTAVSVITAMEVAVGCRNKAELKTLQKFLDRFTIFHLSENISSIANHLIGQYHHSHGLLIPDALIAATALHYGVSLYTKNQKDFVFIPKLIVKKPY